MELLPNLIEEDPFEGKKKTDKKVKREKESSNTSLFSSFIPGWWASEPVEEEVNPLDVEAEDAAKKTIANCSIKSIIDSTWFVYYYYYIKILFIYRILIIILFFI